MEKRIKQDIKSLLKKHATELNLGSWAYCSLPSTENFNYMVVMEYQEGFDKDEHETFIHDGYGLEISVRINKGQYFRNDNPYPIVNSYCDCLDGCTLSDNDIKDDFNSITDFIYDQYRYATENEQYSLKYLQ